MRSTLFYEETAFNSSSLGHDRSPTPDMDEQDKDCLRQVDNLLASNNQSWLFGAGISRGAGIPLMFTLTRRVFNQARQEDEPALKLLEAVKSQLPDDAHIEHILSHLGDYAAMAERSKVKEATVGKIKISLTDLRELHDKILGWVAFTIRWGYTEADGTIPERIGAYKNPVVSVEAHTRFVSALFNRTQAGMAERRRPVRLFTTNYDTLLEDALALCCFPYWDGFFGGALAFRCHHFGEDEPDSGCRAHVIKLHGSIDWHLGEGDRIWRVRDGDGYPSRLGRVLIYPQSTKYLATQRDPFATQFDLLRKALGSQSENVLTVCGYSFGDEHINQEIELALQRSDNKTTILAFVSSHAPNGVLAKWQNKSWSKRLYIISEKGIWVGTEGPYFPTDSANKRDWWTFDGVTKILINGAEACI